MVSLTRRAAAFAMLGASLSLSSCTRAERERKERLATKGGADPLPSWNDGASKRAILDFTHSVASEGPDHVEQSQRIAVFDNDGTLWVEQPIYAEFAFVIDRAREMLAENPALARHAPFNALAPAKAGAPLSLSKDQALALLMATHSGTTQDEFERVVDRWLRTARHPRFQRPYTQCVYQPMLEVLTFLRGNGFKTFIVSGGGVDFMRAFAERTYGVPPEQVIGSSGQGKYELRDGVGVIIKEPRLGSIDDKAGKPVNIALHIGRRPIAAFGNSDGDQQMLEYVSTGAGRRLALLVHHDDAEREYAYDRNSKIGRLSSALDEARTRGWTIVSMRHDWRTIFPAQRHSSVDPL